MTYTWEEFENILGVQIIGQLQKAGLFVVGAELTDRHLSDAKQYIKLAKANNWSYKQVATYVTTGEAPRVGKGGYTLADLTRLTGVPARTIRLWIERGFIHKGLQVADVKRYGVYDDSHVAAIQNLDRMRRSRKSLSEMAISAW